MAFLRHGLLHFLRNQRAALLGLVALAVLFVGVSSSAEPPDFRSWPLPYRVTLEDANGNALRAFRHAGDTFVLGHVGERYRVRIANDSGERVEAVLSVDGRDSVSGRMGDYAEQRGYIVPPRGTIVVDGFRQSLDTVATFRFTDPSSSYSSRMGTPENVGVIGVAFFRERTWPRHAIATRREDPWDAARHTELYGDDASPRRPRASAAPSPSARKPADGRDRYYEGKAPPTKRSTGGAGDASASEAYRQESPWRREHNDDESHGRLGTEYGESGFSSVSEVPFERRSYAHPDAILTLHYDDDDGLSARGIDVYPERRRMYWGKTATPEPFPRNRFAPPPPY